MSCCAIVHDVEGKDDHLLKYMEDYNSNPDLAVKSKHNNLLIEILETFRKDSGFKYLELD